jgi:hypothetical protein
MLDFMCLFPLILMVLLLSPLSAEEQSGSATNEIVNAVDQAGGDLVGKESKRRLSDMDESKIHELKAHKRVREYQLAIVKLKLKAEPNNADLTNQVVLLEKQMDNFQKAIDEILAKAQLAPASCQVHGKVMEKSEVPVIVTDKPYKVSYRLSEMADFPNSDSPCKGTVTGKGVKSIETLVCKECSKARGEWIAKHGDPLDSEASSDE